MLSARNLLISKRMPRLSRTRFGDTRMIHKALTQISPGCLRIEEDELIRYASDRSCRQDTMPECFSAIFWLSKVPEWMETRNHRNLMAGGYSIIPKSVQQVFAVCTPENWMRFSVFKSLTGWISIHLLSDGFVSFEIRMEYEIWKKLVINQTR